MSYIPKYILKRMCPDDCVCLKDHKLFFTMINVISPLTIDQIPDNVLNLFELKIDDDLVFSSTRRVLLDDCTLILNEKSKVDGSNIYTIISGFTIPVGAKIVLVVPNILNLAVGEPHVFEISINIDNPINLSIERTIYAK